MVEGACEKGKWHQEKMSIRIEIKCIGGGKRGRGESGRLFHGSRFSKRTVMIRLTAALFTNRAVSKEGKRKHQHE